MPFELQQVVPKIPLKQKANLFGEVERIWLEELTCNKALEVG